MSYDLIETISLKHGFKLRIKRLDKKRIKKSIFEFNK